MNHHFAAKRMKTALSLLALLATISFGHAGGFGGPPPFTNGSPLITGVDGSYQATAKGQNLTGVFRFTYAGGSQTTAPQFLLNGAVLNDPYNDYIFWVQGTVYRGLVQANINVNLVAGVLDNGGAQIVNSAVGSNSANSFVNIQSYMNGNFTGKMQEQSAYAAFSGKGLAQTFFFTSEIIVITPPTDTQPAITQTVNLINNGPQFTFTFKGIRNAYPSS